MVRRQFAPEPHSHFVPQLYRWSPRGAVAAVADAAAAAVAPAVVLAASAAGEVADAVAVGAAGAVAVAGCAAVFSADGAGVFLVLTSLGFTTSSRSIVIFTTFFFGVMFTRSTALVGSS